MHLSEIHLFRFDPPFAFEFKSSHLSRLRADSVVLKAVFDSGLTGWGESTPRPYVTGETQESVAESIKEAFRSPALKSDFRSLEDVQNALDRLEGALDEPRKGYSSALGAIDLALLDGLAKYRQMPLSGIFGGVVRQEIDYGLTVPLLPASTMRSMAGMVKDMTFRHAKVVMGNDPRENCERVGCIRSLLGDSVELRIEANGNWTMAEALLNLANLREFNISAVEQPLPADDIPGLRKFRKETGVSVVVDESLRHPSDAERLIAEEACDVLNIKISKCGGLLRSKKIAEYAALHGIQCQLGSHVGETPILEKAGECFTLTTPNVSRYEGCSQLLFGSSLASKGGKHIHGVGDFDPGALDPILSLYN